jgi:hypothetical protein
MYRPTRWIRPELRSNLSICVNRLFRIALDPLITATNPMLCSLLLPTCSTIQAIDQLDWPPRPYLTRLIAGTSSNLVQRSMKQANQAVDWSSYSIYGASGFCLVYGYIGRGVSPRCDHQMRCWEESGLWIDLSLIQWDDWYQATRVIVTCYVWRQFAVVGYCPTQQFVSGFEILSLVR